MFGLYTIDAIIVILLIIGALFGFKKGIIKGIVSLGLMILAIVIAWFLKNPIASVMYTKLPFFSFTSSTSLINIIVYEMVAFLIIAIILLILVRIILFFTKLVDKILYIIIFITLFIMYNFTNVYKSIDENTIALRMLNSTPVLTKMVDGEKATFDEIYKLKENYKENDEEYNKELFNVLIKYKIISTNTAKQLVSEGKIKIDGASEIIKRYE